MPIAEPAGSLLWPLVKPKTEWPDTDEDRVRALGDAWRQAGAGFGAAGQTDTSGLGTAWQDNTGNAYQQRLTQARAAAAKVQQFMDAVGGKVTAFAEDVRKTKTAIVDYIAENESVYTGLANAPGGVDQAAMENLVNEVAEKINAFLVAVAAKIGSEGPGGELPDIHAEPEGGGWDAGDWGDLLGIVSAVAGVAAFTPLAPIAAPIAIAAGAGALALHGKDIADKIIDPNESPDWGDWVGLAGDAAGLIPGVKPVAAGYDAFMAATGGIRGGIVDAAHQIAQESSGVASVWEAGGRGLANLVGGTPQQIASEAAVYAKQLQGGAAIAPQVPVAVGLAVEDDTLDDIKDGAGVFSTAVNIAQVVP